MKNAIIKFLGLDKIQQELEWTTNELTKLRTEYDDTDIESIVRNSIDYSELASSVDMCDLADYIDTNDIAYHINREDIAEHIDTYDVACNVDIDYSDLADNIDYNSLQEYTTDAIDMDILAQTVSEKIADRDGMHQMISEEIENQGVDNISTDAVQSMIDAAIQQFADSLEVMVSAKLNYDK